MYRVKPRPPDQLDRVSLNAITTCDGSGATGLGLFPSAAMFNHACTPNCQAWWRGSKVRSFLSLSVSPTTIVLLGCYLSFFASAVARYHDGQLNDCCAFGFSCPRTVNRSYSLTPRPVFVCAAFLPLARPPFAHHPHQLEIRCTKSVAAGEELCFSYIPIDQPSAVRQAQLR